MITLRRAGDRHHVRHRKHEVWSTFSAEGTSAPLTRGFGALRVIDEQRLHSGPALRTESHHAGELITYVQEGAIACQDSQGRTSIVQAGEFQRRPVAHGSRHSEKNVSPTDSARVFQIWVRSVEGGIETAPETRRFSAAQRRGVLCLVASPDGRAGSLCLHQDALVHSSLLGPGQHVVHELSPGRAVWLQLVEGAATVGDVVLGAGDGAAVTTDRAVSITAQQVTEILLFDLLDPLSSGDPVEIESGGAAA